MKYVYVRVQPGDVRVRHVRARHSVDQAHLQERGEAADPVLPRARHRHHRHRRPARVRAAQPRPRHGLGPRLRHRAAGHGAAVRPRLGCAGDNGFKTLIFLGYD